MIMISLAFDQLWSQSTVNDLITIRSWSRQALDAAYHAVLKEVFLTLDLALHGRWCSSLRLYLLGRTMSVHGPRGT